MTKKLRNVSFLQERFCQMHLAIARVRSIRVCVNDSALNGQQKLIVRTPDEHSDVWEPAVFSTMHLVGCHNNICFCQPIYCVYCTFAFWPKDCILFLVKAFCTSNYPYSFSLFTQNFEKSNRKKVCSFKRYLYLTLNLNAKC